MPDDPAVARIIIIPLREPEEVRRRQGPRLATGRNPCSLFMMSGASSIDCITVPPAPVLCSGRPSSPWRFLAPARYRQREEGISEVSHIDEEARRFAFAGRLRKGWRPRSLRTAPRYGIPLPPQAWRIQQAVQALPHRLPRCDEAARHRSHTRRTSGITNLQNDAM
jgi:hypothetical protein